MIELDPLVIDTCKRVLRVPLREADSIEQLFYPGRAGSRRGSGAATAAGLTVAQGDARDFMAVAAEAAVAGGGAADIVFLDAFGLNGIPVRAAARGPRALRPRAPRAPGQPPAPWVVARSLP